jgi:hypothetical protein
VTAGEIRSIQQTDITIQKNKRAYFGQRPQIWNGGTYIEADEVA